MKQFTVILLATLLLTGCATQKNKTMVPKDIISLEYETFDFEKYRDKLNQYNAISYRYEKEDGTKVIIYSGGTLQSGVIGINEVLPAPYFTTLFREYYPSGGLKLKGQLVMKSTFVGKWLECDEDGNCKVVDHDKNKGKFTYEDVLRFVEKRKHVNLKTGEGGENLVANYNYEQQTWGISVGDDYSGRKDYTLDGNTGKVLEDIILQIVP